MDIKIKHLIVGPLLTNCYLLISKGEPPSRDSEAEPRRSASTLRGRQVRCGARISLRGEAAVVDPGGEVKEIFREIKENNLKLNYIILTHGHWDHTFSVLKIKEKTGAKILLHEAEKEFVKFKVDEFLKEGSEIKIGGISLKVIHTPGHTKGSICLLDDGLIFTGDTIFKDGYGRTDLAGGSQEDLENSLKKLSKILKPKMKVYPGHGEIFEIK